MSSEAKHDAIYWRIFLALAGLTVLTVAASYIQLGHGLNLATGLVIAVCKASLVAMFFMHLKYEGALNRGVALFPVVCFMILAGVLVVDLTDRWIDQWGNKGASHQVLEGGGGHGGHH
ncbi:MAG: cytochrome C oxidase subunit IV family protein [Planctomycetes bacterium]|nr:cytochrome C oxidase subunit IV family protein [Planctomycetota bacterium]